MEVLDKKRKKTKSASNSPRDDNDKSPRIKLIGSEPTTPKIVCPACKTTKDVVRLGIWKDRDAAVYLCGQIFPDEKACRNVWIPDLPHIQIDEVCMRYLPGPDGIYFVTFV